MSGLFMPSERNEKKAEVLPHLAAGMQREFSAIYDDVSEEDGDYRGWLNGHSKSIRKDMKTYFEKLGRENPDSGLLRTLEEKTQAYDRLAEVCGQTFTPSPEDVDFPRIPLRTDEEIARLEELQTSEWLEEKADREKEARMWEALDRKKAQFLKEQLNGAEELMEGLAGMKTGEKSFAQAAAEFNAATGYKYADDPEMKTVMKMIRRTEKVCGIYEEAAIADCNAEVEDRFEKLDGIAKQTKEYLDAQKALEDSITDKARLNPDNLESVNAHFEKTARETDERIREKDALLAEKRGQLVQTEEQLAALGESLRNRNAVVEDKDGTFRDLTAHQTNKMNAAERQKKEAEQRIEEHTRLIGETEKEIKQLDGSIEAAIKSKEVEKEVLKKSSLSAYGRNFFEKRQDREDARALAAAEGVGGEYADKESAKALTDSEFGKTFIRLYDRYKPAVKPQTGVRGLFSNVFSEKPAENGTEALRRCVEKAKFGKDGNDLDKYLRQETEKLHASVETAMKKSRDDRKLEEYDKALTAIENRVPDMEQLRAKKENTLREYEAENEKDRELVQEADGKIGECRRELDKYAVLRENAGKESAADAEKLEALQAKLDEQKKEILELEKSRGEDKKLLDQTLRYARKNLDEPMEKLRARNERSAGVLADIGAYKEAKTEQLPKMKDGRPERINARLDGFLRRIAENQGSHKNTKEYNDLVDALVNARQGGTKELENTIPALQLAAETYLQKKGSRTLSIGNLRSTRMSFAREIRDFSKGLAETLNEPVYPGREDLPDDDGSIFSDDGSSEGKELSGKWDELKKTGLNVKRVSEGAGAFRIRPERLGDVYLSIEKQILEKPAGEAFPAISAAVDKAEKEAQAKRMEIASVLVAKAHRKNAAQQEGSVLGSEPVVPGKF